MNRTWKVRICEVCGREFPKRQGQRQNTCKLCLFWEKVDRSGGIDACWPWLGARSVGGYGKVGVSLPGISKSHLAHRVAWILTNGPIPEDLIVIHNCDVRYAKKCSDYRRCCNPSHVRLGTHADNTLDRVQKGRGDAGRGNRHGSKTQPMRVASGSRHGSKTHPERIATGERHGSKTQPERIARGLLCGAHTHPESRLYGDKNPQAKLSESDIREIRKSTLTEKSLAQTYRVSSQEIGKIRRRQRWGHIPD
jgi:HNH endonuclease